MLDDATFAEEDLNPIDSLESVLHGYNWVFDRKNDEELFVKLTGKEIEYNVYFIWDENAHLLQVCCQYDLRISHDNLPAARDAIVRLNDDLCLGHFSLPAKSTKPAFRYSALMKALSADQARAMINDIVDMSLVQCERFCSAFKILSAENAPNHAELELAMMETQGQS